MRMCRQRMSRTRRRPAGLWYAEGWSPNAASRAVQPSQSEQYAAPFLPRVQRPPAIAGGEERQGASGCGGGNPSWQLPRQQVASHACCRLRDTLKRAGTPLRIVVGILLDLVNFVPRVQSYWQWDAQHFPHDEEAQNQGRAGSRQQSARLAAKELPTSLRPSYSR
jgi:hypothetical protein